MVAARAARDAREKRFERRAELQLLLMEPAEVKAKFSAMQWRQMMTSGLQKPEVRCPAAHGLCGPPHLPTFAPISRGGHEYALGHNKRS